MNINRLHPKRYKGKGQGEFRMNSKARQFVKRAKGAVTRFHKGGIDYERTMDLLTEHADRVYRLDDRAVSLEERTFALNRIYELMHHTQTRENGTVHNHGTVSLDEIEGLDNATASLSA